MPDGDPTCGAFPATLWTQIVRARDGSDATRRDALDKLLTRYWSPLYAAVRYGWNRPQEEARDLTQEFLTDLLQRRFWESIDPDRGRFRSFLKAALKHFMLNEVRDRARLKRAGAQAPVPIDELPLADYTGCTPDEALDREWIAAVLRQAVERLRLELERENKRAYFEVLRRYDLEPEIDKPTYGAVASALGLNESDVRNYLHQARGRLRALVRELVLEYCAGDAELREELRFILE